MRDPIHFFVSYKNPYQKLKSRSGPEQGREVFTQGALEVLLCYEEPGNARELRNFKEATFVNSPLRSISIENFPEIFRTRLRKTEGSSHDGRDPLLTALLATNWNKNKASQPLQWSRMTLYREMGKYGGGYLT